MRSILIDLGSDPVVAGTAINSRVQDVRLAVALLVGAASVAEAELAGAAFATRAATRKVLRACRAFEAAVAGPTIAAVNTACMPSPATLDAIAAVSAVSACLPSLEVQKAIGTVAAANAAFERSVRGDAVAEIHQEGS